MSDIKPTERSSEARFSKIIDEVASSLPPNEAQKFIAALNDKMQTPPKIAIIGKSGAGKTTTINALFGTNWHVSDIKTGTTEAQQETFTLKSGSKITMVDMPGLGDSRAKDAIFINEYKRILPEADIILYVLQADDRGFASDMKILKEVVLPCAKNALDKIIIGINKVDLLGMNEGLKWNRTINLPSERQAQLIEQKCTDAIKRISKSLGLKKENIVYFSAIQYYRLYELLYCLVMAGDVRISALDINPGDFIDLIEIPEVKKQALEYREKLRKENALKQKIQK